MEAQPKEIQIYVTTKGNCPFEEWLNTLKDQKAVLKIDHRLRRVRLGNLGDYKSVGDGIFGHWYRLARSYKRCNTRGSRNQANLE
jgi:putative addiction module killer protein